MLKSWVINVKKSKVKRDFFSKQANSINLDFKYFNAVTPDKLNLYEFVSNKNTQRKFFARPLLDTEIACAVSHRTLWKQLLNDDEVEKLIAKNAKALRQIRHDANMMKQSILLEEDKKSVL